MRSTGFAVLALGLLVSCATTGAERANPVLYKARGNGWELTIAEDVIRLRERVAQGRLEYHGPLPPMTREAAVIWFEGEMLREYVVAGLAEEDVRRYALEISNRPCRDADGKRWPTTVTLNFFAEYKPVGCGGPLPTFAHPHRQMTGQL